VLPGLWESVISCCLSPSAFPYPFSLCFFLPLGLSLQGVFFKKKKIFPPFPPYPLKFFSVVFFFFIIPRWGLRSINTPPCPNDLPCFFFAALLYLLPCQLPRKARVATGQTIPLHLLKGQPQSGRSFPGQSIRHLPRVSQKLFFSLSLPQDHFFGSENQGQALSLPGLISGVSASAGMPLFALHRPPPPPSRPQLPFPLGAQKQSFFPFFYTPGLRHIIPKLT